MKPRRQRGRSWCDFLRQHDLVALWLTGFAVVTVLVGAILLNLGDAATWRAHYRELTCSNVALGALVVGAVVLIQTFRIVEMRDARKQRDDDDRREPRRPRREGRTRRATVALLVAPAAASAIGAVELVMAVRASDDSPWDWIRTALLLAFAVAAGMYALGLRDNEYQ